MEAIIYNFNESSLSSDMENLALRTAYILCLNVKSVSTIWPRILYEEYFGSLSVKNKMLTLIDLNSDEEGKESMQTTFDMYFNATKIKHKPPQMLAAIKKMEISVQGSFKDWMDYIINNEYEQTFLSLNELVKPGALEVFRLFHDNAEHQDNDYVSLSKVFLNTHASFEQKTNLFFLPAELFEGDVFEKLNLFSSADPEAENPANTYLDICINFFDLRILTSPEMQAIRSQLQPLSDWFISALNEWAEMFSAIESNHERLIFFKEKVLPAAANFNAALQENELLKPHLISQNDSGSVQVLVGEMPLSIIYENYRDWKVIPETSWIKIAEADGGKKGLNGRWPVIALKSNLHLFDTKENKDAIGALFQQGKKSIIID